MSPVVKTNRTYPYGIIVDGRMKKGFFINAANLKCTKHGGIHHDAFEFRPPFCVFGQTF